MKAIILCGGLGSRLSSIVSDKPKPLAPVAGKPFLDHVITWLTTQSVNELIFSLNYKADQIVDYVGDGKRFLIKPTFVIEKKPKGTGGAVAYAIQKAKLVGEEKVLVVNGDTFFNINLPAFVKFHADKRADLSIALSSVLDTSRYGEIRVDEGDRIVEFREKTLTTGEEKAGLVSGGIYLFGKKALRVLCRAKSPFFLETDFFARKTGKLSIYGYPSDTTHFDIGTPTGYRRTEKYLSGRDEIVIRSRAPLRLSFGGGGTDVPPFDEKFGGCVLNTTIDKYVYGTLKLREDRKVHLVSADYRRSILYSEVRDLVFDGHLDLVKAIIKRMDINYGFEIQIHSDVPPNSGMGSSASLAVAIIGLFNHLSVEKKLTKSQIAELAFEVETNDLKNIGGRQDQYAAVFGGVNFFEFMGRDFVKINPLYLDRRVILELEKNLVLAYVGSRGVSGKQHEKSKDGSSSRNQYLTEMKKNGYETYYALLRSDLTRFGTLLEETWKLKKNAFPGSSSPQIDKIYTEAKKAGAVGGRITGAGGGGHMIFYCETSREQDVANKLDSLGVKVIDFGLDFYGLQTWEI